MPASDLTDRLNRWQQGDGELDEAVVEALYPELRKIARRLLRREASAHTLQATAAAHEIYLRLAQVRGLVFRDRSHFLAFSVRLARRMLVDQARRRRRFKRGEGQERVSLEEAGELALPEAPDVLAVHEALERLSRWDEIKGRLVELRFFGGLSFSEIAACLELPPDTVALEWRRAKAWLRRDLGRLAAEVPR